MQKSPACEIGIYLIWCTKRCGFYIGATRHFRWRRNNHLHLLNIGNHHSKDIQFLYDQHGRNSIRIELFCFCDETNLHELEEKYIKLMQPAFNKGGKMEGGPDLAKLEQHILCPDYEYDRMERGYRMYASRYLHSA